MTDDPLDWPPAFDDEAYGLIGRIIAAWSEIHEFIHAEITSLQTRIYVLRKRAAGQPNFEVPGFGAARARTIIPDTQFRLRLKYYRRLVRALAQGDDKVLKQLDRATESLPQLYEIRNDLAHSRIYVGSRWQEPQIELTSHEWFDKWQRNVDRNGYTKSPPSIIKKYSLADLRSQLGKMEQAFSALLHIDVPMKGLPEPPEPSSRKGRRT